MLLGHEAVPLFIDACDESYLPRDLDAGHIQKCGPGVQAARVVTSQVVLFE
jgi:hypothetical protein